LYQRIRADLGWKRKCQIKFFQYLHDKPALKNKVPADTGTPTVWIEQLTSIRLSKKVSDRISMNQERRPN
jgi:hypothetical protein